VDNPTYLLALVFFGFAQSGLLGYCPQVNAPGRVEMPAVSLKNMDVSALLELRREVENTLTERARDLQSKIALLGEGRRRPGRPTGRVERASALRGVKVAPKYRGPGGETWAGRGAKPRWLTALLKEGHSLEKFAIASKGGKAAPAAAKKPVATKRGRKAAGKKAGR
jgi:DNA-binding protein H-NS